MRRRLLRGRRYPLGGDWHFAGGFAHADADDVRLDA